MSRPMMEPIAIKPQNDVYTGLLAVTLVAVVVGLVILFVRSATLFPGNPLWQG